MSKINDFLTECGCFYMATVAEGGVPRLRPLGLHLEMDGKIYFGVGNNKEVYAQLQKNPNVEIVAKKPHDTLWLRYTGKAVFTSDPAPEAAALEALPQLKQIYNAETGLKLMMFSLEDAKALLIQMMGEGEDITGK